MTATWISRAGPRSDAVYFALLSQAVGETIPHTPQGTASADTAVRAEMYDAYLSGMLAAHAGQALDIQGHHREFDEAAATAENRTLLDCLRVTYSLKSGAMEGVSLQIAALASGATREPARALREFGTAMGTAYQTSDDVADLYGVPRNGRATKRVGEDLHNAKVTMPLAHAVALLPPDRLRQLWDLISRGGAAPETVREVAALGGGLELSPVIRRAVRATGFPVESGRGLVRRAGVRLSGVGRDTCERGASACPGTRRQGAASDGGVGPLKADGAG